MKCSDMQELLALYADDSLEGEDAFRVKQHLDACAFCREELVYLQESLGLLHGQAAPPLPPGLHQHIMAGVREEKRQRAKAKGTPGFWLRFPRSMAAAAAVFLMFLVGGNLYLTNQLFGGVVMDAGYRSLDFDNAEEALLASEDESKDLEDDASAPAAQEELTAAQELRRENPIRDIVLYNAALLSLGSGGLWYYYRRKNKSPRKTGD